MFLFFYRSFVTSLLHFSHGLVKGLVTMERCALVMLILLMSSCVQSDLHVIHVTQSPVLP